METEPSESMRVSAVVDLDAVRHNLRVMSTLPHVRGTAICAVLKADGYGHGAVAIAKALEHEDIVSSYAVATADEAVELKVKAGVKKPVMILGYAFPESDEVLFRYDIEPSVFREDTVQSLEETAKRLHTTKKLRVHIPVDTGMGRIGVTPDDDGLAFVRRVAESDALKVEGIFTHFSSADEADGAFTDLQTTRFQSFLDRINEELHLEVPVIHADNSAAIITGRGCALDMIRAGIAMYGYAPSSETETLFRGKEQLQPVLSFFSHISHLKRVPAGTPVSYGRTFVADRDSLIATVPVGYADGYPRMLSNKADVLIGGKRAPVAGRVCMDQFMVDVTDLTDVHVGDRVTLIGTDGDEQITAKELGDISGRFHYELLCCINKRVPRICKGA